MILETDIHKLLRWLDESHMQENAFNRDKSKLEKQCFSLQEKIDKLSESISKNMKNRNLIIERINELKK